MAYINGVQMMRDIGVRAQELGARVIFAPGWETRGNGQSWPAGGPKGFVNHHTAGGNNIYLDQNLITGIPGLTGPLCNVAGLYDGDICIVSAGPANHAGASGGWDTAPLPRTGMFNREVLGYEIQYRGTEPMSDAQYRSALILNRAAMDVMGWGAHNVLKFHQGTSIQGKWDPGYATRPERTYDIYKFREQVAELGKTEKDGFLMALAPSEQKEVLTGARQLSAPLKTRGGEKWVGEMIVELFNELTYQGYESLFDQRNPVEGRAPFTGSPVRYILEIDAKLEQIRLDGKRTADAIEKIAATLAASKKESK